MNHFKSRFLVFFFLFSLIITAQTKETIFLWTNDVPGEVEEKQPARQTDNISGNVIRLTDVTNPNLTVYRPEKPNGSRAGIIVCPGGGYNILAFNKEGTEIAEWLNDLGYTAFVLEYRVPKKREGALQDIQRATRIIRYNASKYNLDTEKIGVMGFSAGGHLATIASTSFNRNSYVPIDQIDKQSVRLNFTMLMYPAYLDNGKNRSVSPELVINNTLPPFFVFATADDKLANSALVISTALRDHKVPVELHLMPKGGHGYGLRKGNIASETWPVLAEKWLSEIVNTEVKNDKTPINNIQVIGSHNSYKIEIEKPLFDFLYKVNPKKISSLQYGHISLVAQLDLGLRNLELDVFYDPDGGYYKKPKGLKVLKWKLKKTQPFDLENKLDTPGLKMFHVQDFDFRSHHLLFKEGLEAIKKWSNAHPEHTPITILINAKDQKVEKTRDPLPFTKEALNTIDNEIISILGVDKLITPDLVRGNFKNLEEAVLTEGWPNFGAVKGRFLFVLDEKSEKNNRYLEGHESLKSRVLFVNSKEGNPEAAFRIINDPVKNFDYIKELVAKGYMVRTRADAGTKEARTIDYSRFEKAKASGAQVISTDYYIPSTLFESDFKIIFEDETYERIKTK